MHVYIYTLDHIICDKIQVVELRAIFTFLYFSGLSNF